VAPGVLHWKGGLIELNDGSAFFVANGSVEHGRGVGCQTFRTYVRTFFRVRGYMLSAQVIGDRGLLVHSHVES
jgi:hypothetical protein